MNDADIFSFARNGKLPFTRENFEKMAGAVLQSEIFMEAIEVAGLGSLPDPDNEFANQPAEGRAWLISCLQAADRRGGRPIRSEAKCRKLLERALKEMRQELGTAMHRAARDFIGIKFQKGKN